MEVLKVLDTPQQIKELQSILADAEYVAYDIETTGLERTDEIIGYSVATDDKTAYYVILAKWIPQDSKMEYLVDNRNASKELIKSLKNKKLLMHNAVFDCKMTEIYLGISLIDSVHTDTMILAHLLDENRRVGLKELASSMFGETSAKEQKEMKASIEANGGSCTKANYELFKADPYLIGKYGAKDAMLTFKLFEALIPQLFEEKLDAFFYDDECMPLLRGPTYELNTIGLQVDTKALTALKKSLEAECAKDKAFIYSEINKYISKKYPGKTKKDTFNIGSSQQLAWLMFGELGLDFGALTDAGKELCHHLAIKIPYYPAARRDFLARILREEGQILEPASIINGKKKNARKIKAPWAYIACDKKTLHKLAPKHKWIEVLLRYQKTLKILNTYVEGLEERIRYGIISPSFLQSGTTSGRYSSRNPNFQNLPRDDKRVKACIVSRPGKCYVGADYSQLEPRVFAYTSGDSRLMAAFQGQDDFYSVIGMEVYGKIDCIPRKDGSPEAFGIKYKQLRDLSKVIALASTYGATAHQLAPTTGKSIDDTQNDIDTYFENFPDVKKMMLESHSMAKDNGVVYNHFGRPRRMPDAKLIKKHYGNQAHKDLPYDARNLLNLAVNHRIQSTGASIVNRAAIAFHKTCKEVNIDCKIVVQVHDSLVVECNEVDAEDISVLLQDAMEHTIVLKGIKLEAIPRIGYNLSEV